jgi:hypothetical protein
MKTFVFLHYGFVPPTPEIGTAWREWYESIADRIVDGGKPFRVGHEISKDGERPLPLGPDSITGYTIISAENLDEAIEIARNCPSIAAIRVYEAAAM